MVIVENGIPARSIPATMRLAASPWPNSALKKPTTFTPVMPDGLLMAASVLGADYPICTWLDHAFRASSSSNHATCSWTRVTTSR